MGVDIKSVLKNVILLKDVMFTKRLKHLVEDLIVAFKSENVASKIVACPHNVACNNDIERDFLLNQNERKTIRQEM
jgi:hypothetical protein